jgi:hypothetical protein
VPATLLARAEEVIEWGADCCGARVRCCRLRNADEHQECLLIGVDRKGPAHGQSDTIDPTRTSGNLLSLSAKASYLGALNWKQF